MLNSPSLISIPSRANSSPKLSGKPSKYESLNIFCPSSTSNPIPGFTSRLTYPKTSELFTLQKGTMPLNISPDKINIKQAATIENLFM